MLRIINTIDDLEISAPGYEPEKYGEKWLNSASGYQSCMAQLPRRPG
jgi:hypothetical protein